MSIFLKWNQNKINKYKIILFIKNSGIIFSEVLTF